MLYLSYSTLLSVVLPLLLNLPAHSHLRYDKGLGTGYSAWEPEYMMIRGRRIRVSTGKPYCWWLKKVKKGEPIVAHRSLPCGTRLYIRVAGRTTGAFVRVGDRGPYGACVRRSDLQALRARGTHVIWQPSSWCRRRYGPQWVWYVKKKRYWPGVYRGLVDVSHTARKLFRHNGYQTVEIFYGKLGLVSGDESAARNRRREGRRGAPDIALGAPR